MEYRKYGDAIYIRGDKGDEIISCILDVCRREGIGYATFSGIGGCDRAEIQTFLPEKGEFETQALSGMLELVCLNGNVVSGEAGERKHHTHALFAFQQNGAHGTAGGHVKSIRVLYTAEIELRPVIGGVISQTKNPETGTGFWKFT